jgi:formamidopyrimidine-DNA glycosylase
MPELPEVETLKRQLNSLVVGQRLDRIEIIDQKLGPPPQACRLITGVTRRGKELVLLMEDGLFLSIHLRMTGRLLWLEGSEELPRHVRAVFHLERGRLVLVDPRRFAVIKLLKDAPPPGLSENLPDIPDAALLALRGGVSRRPVKTFLLDQAVFPGMGNIYACETLFRALIDPRRPAAKITAAEWVKISAAAREILTNAIDLRGTSISDWRDLGGSKGENQKFLSVYGRNQVPCTGCGTPVQRLKIGGRGTFFCPSCQR